MTDARGENNRGKQALAFSLAVATGAILAYIGATQEPLDLEVYYQAGRALVQGDPIYGDRYGRSGVSFFLYPPPFAQLMGILSQVVSFATLKPLWFAASAISGVFTCFLISSASTRLMTALLLLIWSPTLHGLAWGQVHLFILAALMLAMHLLGQRRWLGSALALNVAMLIKISPVVLLVTLIQMRKWRCLALTLLILLAVILPSLLLPYPNQLYIDFAKFIAWFAEAAPEQRFSRNYAVQSVILAPFGWEKTNLAKWGLSCTIIMLYCRLFLRNKTNQLTTDYQLELDSLRRSFCLGIVLMVALSPTVWLHHLVWLFPCLLILSRADLDTDDHWQIQRWVAATGFVAIMLLPALHIAAGLINHFYGVNFTAIVRAIPCLCLLAVAICLSIRRLDNPDRVFTPK